MRALRSLLLAAFLLSPLGPALALQAPDDCSDLDERLAGPCDEAGRVPEEAARTIADSSLGGAMNTAPVRLWTSLNDGAGSGLDADTLDGHSSGAFWSAIQNATGSDAALRAHVDHVDAAHNATEDALAVDVAAEAAARASEDQALLELVRALEAYVNGGALRGSRLDLESSAGNFLRFDPARMRILFEHSTIRNSISSTNAGLTVNNVTASRDGRLGVGMLYPSEALDVAGNARLGGVADPYLRLQPTTPDGKSWLVQSQGNGRLRFFQETDARQPLTLQPGGEVDVGGPLYVYGPATFRDTMRVDVNKPGNLDLAVSNANLSGASRLLASKEFGALSMEVHGNNGAAASDARAPGSGTLYHSPHSPLSLVAADGDLRFYAGCDTVACLRAVMDTTGRVGIGTASPDAALQVSESGAAGEVVDALILDNPRAYGVGSGNFGAGIAFTTSEGGTLRPTSQILARAAGVVEHETSSGNGALALYTRSGCGTCVTEKVRVTSGGNVGIGTTSPDARLEVSHAGDPGKVIDGVIVDNSRAFGPTAGAFGSAIAFSTSEGGTLRSNERILGRIAGVVEDPTNSHWGALVFSTREGEAGERMRLTGSGRLGIGTTSPQAALDVAGDARVSGALMAYGGKAGFTAGGTDLILAGRGGGVGSSGRALVDAGGEGLVVNYGNDFGRVTITGNVSVPGTLSLRGDAGDVINGPGYHWNVVNDADGNVHLRSWSGRRVQINEVTFAQGGDGYTGRVGIGTTTPRSPLEVRGDIRADGGNVFWAGGSSHLNTDQGGSIELGDSTQSGLAPYIDFHRGVGAAEDFNVRLVNDASGQLSLVGGNLRLTQALRFSGTNLPPCDAVQRGQQRFIEGAVGVADALYMCMKSSADTYSWRIVQSG